MISYCKSSGKDIKLLCYGTALGGLLSEKWIGKAEPKTDKELNTSSLSKFKRFVDRWGPWSLFQELLRELKAIADSKPGGITITNIAIKYILDKPQVAGVIIGTRLGLSEHRKENAKILSVTLTEEDLARIHKIIAKGKTLPGDCGDEYRGWK